MRLLLLISPLLFLLLGEAKGREVKERFATKQLTGASLRSGPAGMTDKTSDRHITFFTALNEGDREAMEGLSLEYRRALLLISMVLERSRDAYYALPPEKQGYLFGRLIFEIVGLEVVLAKAGKLTQLDRLTELKTRVAGKPGFNIFTNAIEEVATLLRKYEGMCFTAGTPILTQTGMLPIEQIEPGMFVWSRDEATGAEGLKPVLQTFITHPMEVHHLTYRTTGPPASAEAADHHITATGTHPFWVCGKEKFIPVSQLHPGDTFRTAKGGYATLITSEIETAAPGQTFTTYNFEVADWHTYHAGPLPLWVHNTGDHCNLLTTAFIEQVKLLGGPDTLTLAGKRLEILQVLREKAKVENWHRLIPDSEWSRANRILIDQEIALHEGLGRLTRLGPNEWVSSGGLKYGPDNQYGNRIQHVLRHIVDDPMRTAPHGVFDFQRNEILKLLDLAWQKKVRDGILPETTTHPYNDIFIVDMNTPVGIQGGIPGTQAGNPLLSKIKFVVRRSSLTSGFPEIITAFPF
jgi:Pretoxin HINT domain